MTACSTSVLGSVWSGVITVAGGRVVVVVGVGETKLRVGLSVDMAGGDGQPHVSRQMLWKKKTLPNSRSLAGRLVQYPRAWPNRHCSGVATSAQGAGVVSPNPVSSGVAVIGSVGTDGTRVEVGRVGSTDGVGTGVSVGVTLNVSSNGELPAHPLQVKRHWRLNSSQVLQYPARRPAAQTSDDSSSMLEQCVVEVGIDPGTGLGTGPDVWCGVGAEVGIDVGNSVGSGLADADSKGERPLQPLQVKRHSSSNSSHVAQNP